VLMVCPRLVLSSEKETAGPYTPLRSGRDDKGRVGAFRRDGYWVDEIS
jgi:hypothetical protein